MRININFIATVTFFITFASCKNESNPYGDGSPITPQKVYTADNPGNWRGREGEHTPVVKFLSNSGDGNVEVSVTLKNPSPSHFIEKILIAEESGKPYQ